MPGLFDSHWIWYVVLVFLPVTILFMIISLAIYIYFFTSCTIADLYKKPPDPAEAQNLLDNSKNDGRPRLMSRFLTQAELQEVFMLPEYVPRSLDLTAKEREFLSQASKVRCARSDQHETEEYVNFIDHTKFALLKKNK